jgi:hypothetical protein
MSLKNHLVDIGAGGEGSCIFLLHFWFSSDFAANPLHLNIASSVRGAKEVV